MLYIEPVGNTMVEKISIKYNKLYKLFIQKHTSFTSYRYKTITLNTLITFFSPYNLAFDVFSLLYNQEVLQLIHKDYMEYIKISKENIQL